MNRYLLDTIILIYCFNGEMESVVKKQGVNGNAREFSDFGDFKVSSDTALSCQITPRNAGQQKTLLDLPNWQ